MKYYNYRCVIDYLIRIDINFYIEVVIWMVKDMGSLRKNYIMLFLFWVYTLIINLVNFEFS